jgi:hypothetical protein
MHAQGAEPSGTLAWLGPRPLLARHHHIRLAHPKARRPAAPRPALAWLRVPCFPRCSMRERPKGSPMLPKPLARTPASRALT